jgi:hypothetical protein
MAEKNVQKSLWRLPKKYLCLSCNIVMLQQGNEMILVNELVYNQKDFLAVIINDYLMVIYDYHKGM